METRSNQVLVGSVTLGLLAALVGLHRLAEPVRRGRREDLRHLLHRSRSKASPRARRVTFSRRARSARSNRSTSCPHSPQFVRVRINVSDETPVLEGTTATIRGVGFTGVSQIQLDPPETPEAGNRRAPRREIRCPEENPQSECPYGVPVIPTRPGALGQLLNTAPELLERVSTLTERLTELLSDRNQESIAGILDNLEEVSRISGRALAGNRGNARRGADRDPPGRRRAADRIGRLAGSTNGPAQRGRPAADQRSAPDAPRGRPQHEQARGARSATPGPASRPSRTRPCPRSAS